MDCRAPRAGRSGRAAVAGTVAQRVRLPRQPRRARADLVEEDEPHLLEQVCVRPRARRSPRAPQAPAGSRRSPHEIAGKAIVRRAELACDVERAAVCRAQQLRLPGAATAPDGPDRVDHPARREVAARSSPSRRPSRNRREGGIRPGSPARRHGESRRRRRRPRGALGFAAFTIASTCWSVRSPTTNVITAARRARWSDRAATRGPDRARAARRARRPHAMSCRDGS